MLTTILFIRDFGDATGPQNLFAGLVVLFLWFTVLFANFAEAMAEGRGKAQAATLRKTRARPSPTSAATEAHSSRCLLAARDRRHLRRVGGAGDPRRR